jgi:adenylate cyclase
MHAFLARMAVVALPLVALISVYYAVWAPLRPDHGTRLEAAVSNLVALVVFAGLFTVLFRWRHRRRLQVALRWMDACCTPTPEETRAVFGLPSKLAAEQFGAILLVGVLLAVGNVYSGALGFEWLRTLVGLGLFGATLAALTYLIAEATLRPVFARFGTVTTHSALAVGTRLLVAWAVGSLVPLLFIASIPLRGTAGQQLPTTAPMEFMAWSAVAIGAITTVFVARSIAEPLAVVRVALRRVEDGDLTVELAVDDPGEVGEVQTAFNRMVQGLRERSALQDMFGRHVGTEVARQALVTGVQLGGETRDATVLFIDLIGSTALAERQSPTEVVDLLNRFFGEVVRVVETEGGWVDKFEGDGALAVFGVPTHIEDHQARGLSAARSLNDALTRDGIATGIGVSCGELVAGNVGTERRFEYTVIGRPVNQAARLADLAKSRTPRVLASAQVGAAAGDEAEHWVPDGTVPLRGIDQAVAVITLSQG